MGRLIDADVLKESLKKVTIVIDEDVLKCETLNDELLYLLERVEAEMKKKIDECLTAFDVEAVVKELEEYVEQHKDYYQIGEDFLSYGACIPLKKAIEIVKGGVK